MPLGLPASCQADLRARGGAFVPSTAGCGAGWWWEAVGLAVRPKQLAQVRVCATPCTPQGHAGARLALQVQAWRPGSTCLFSEGAR